MCATACAINLASLSGHDDQDRGNNKPVDQQDHSQNRMLAHNVVTLSISNFFIASASSLLTASSVA